MPTMTDVALQVGVHIFLHGTLVLGGAWLLVRYGPDAPAAATHATWVAAFVVLLLLPLGYASIPGWTWTLDVDPTPERSAYGRATPRTVSGPTSSADALAATSSNGEESVGETPPSAPASSTDAVRWTALYHWSRQWLAPAFLLIWGGGTLLLLGRLGVGLRTLWCWQRTATELEDSALPTALARQLDVRRSVSVRHSSAVRTPVVWGLVSPVILLPSAAIDWSRTRLRTVLLHELAHVKRRDALTHLLSRVARACFWPNPLVWSASAAATSAQEQACDDAVLRSGIASWKYAEHLLAVTKTLRRGPVPLNAVALDAGLRFKSRMRALLKSTPSRRSLAPRELGLFVAAGTLLLFTLSAVQIGSSENPDERSRHHRLEAESATLPSAFDTQTDEDASGGAYVKVTEDANRDRPPQTDPVVYPFETSRAGPHLIWARVRVSSGDHNSFWLRVDSTRWIQWNGIEEGEQWHWVQVRDIDQDGRPVAFDLSAGSHQLQLRPREDEIEVDRFVVTDDWHYRPRAPEDGATTNDRAHRIWLDAEDGWLEAPLRVENAPAASGWRYLAAPPAENSLESPPATGHATFSFTVPSADSYRLWGRVVAPSGSSNSFWLRVNEGPWIRWNGIREGDRWHWDQVHDSDDDETPVRFDLSEGTHQLTVAYREDDVKLDRLLLTADATYRPRGPGERLNASSPFSKTLSPEDARLTAPMVHRTDSSSTDPAAWLGVPDGPGNDAPEGGTGAATWTVSVPEDGDYVLWGEVEAPATNDNSFYVSVDGGEEVAWHTPGPEETADEWTWDPVSSLASGEHTDPVVFSLEEGRHRIRIRNREDGTRLRRLRVTNRPARGPTAVRP